MITTVPTVQNRGLVTQNLSTFLKPHDAQFIETVDSTIHAKRFFSLDRFLMGHLRSKTAKSRKLFPVTHCPVRNNVIPCHAEIN
jgi:hypothetical protein